MTICGECVQNSWIIEKLAADLKTMADNPGGDDGHEYLGWLLESLVTAVEIARADGSPELTGRDLGDFLAARKTGRGDRPNDRGE